MKESNQQKMRRWRIRCGSRGVFETYAVSPAKAVSNIVWRMRKDGVIPMKEYWDEPEEVK